MANDEVNAYKFWRRIMVSALTYNNGYGYIDKNGRGEVLGLYNLLPDRTTPVRVKGRLVSDRGRWPIGGDSCEQHPAH